MLVVFWYGGFNLFTICQMGYFSYSMSCDYLSALYCCTSNYSLKPCSLGVFRCKSNMMLLGWWLCAPGGVRSPLDWSEGDWNANIRTNLTGQWLVTKHVCRHMRDAKLKGSVINISSIGAINRGHLPGGIAYAASKAGVNTITKVMFYVQILSSSWWSNVQLSVIITIYSRQNYFLPN